MHEGADIFEITVSNENFDFWSNQEFITDDIRADIKNADILMVPTIGFRDTTGPNFPPLTEEILAYFKANTPADYKVDIAVSDEAFASLTLNNDFKRYGKYVITVIAVPVFINVLSNYINHKLDGDPKPNITIINNTTNNYINKPEPVTPVAKKLKVKKPHKFLEPAKVSFSVTVVDTIGKSIKYDYQGPADEVKKVTDVLKKDWINDNR